MVTPQYNEPFADRISKLEHQVQELVASVEEILISTTSGHPAQLESLLPPFRSGFILPQLKGHHDLSPNLLLSPRRELKVGCILDQFSFHCFKDEFDLIPLTPENWEHELSTQSPDFLIVESAWSGQNGEWSDLTRTRYEQVIAIVSWFQKREKATFFWNKEDPTHTDHFLPLASHFDYVLTTDVQSADKYVSHLGDERVHVFPFAAQPRLHNPFELYERKLALSLAGSGYSRYHRRESALLNFVDSFQNRIPIEIFDRSYGTTDERYHFPKEVLHLVQGKLDYEDIDIAYKGYFGSINLTSITDSPTMMARRAFELAASNTLIVSNYSPALKYFFGDSVISTDDGEEAWLNIRNCLEDSDAYSQRTLSALRHVARNHTYAHRANTLAELAGLAPALTDERIHLFSHVETPKDIENVLNNNARQSVGATSLTLFTTDESLTSRFPDIDLRTVNSMQCDGVEICHPFVSVIDPSAELEENYLEDLSLAFTYSSADVVGYSHLPGANNSHTAIDSLKAGHSLARSHVYQGLSPTVLTAETLLSSGSNKMLQIPKPKATLIPPGFDSIPANVLGKSPLQASSTQNQESKTALLMETFSSTDSKWSLDEVDGEVCFSCTSKANPSYLWAVKTHDLASLTWEEEGRIELGIESDSNVWLVVIFMNEEDERLGNEILIANKKHTFKIRPGTSKILFALRSEGPSSGKIQSFTFGAPNFSSNVPILTSSDVMITNAYPSYNNLYSNAFVHTRALAYEQAGSPQSVVVAKNVSTTQCREYQGVDVVETNCLQLRKILKRSLPHSLNIHFLNESMWDAISRSEVEGRINIWIHGFEIQPWWRRNFGSESAETSLDSQIASAARLNFWKKLFSSCDPRTHFIFVSRHFANEVFKDLGIKLPDDKYSIIHNPIDTELFHYERKIAADRYNILSIRPYSSRKYANDLSVKAVELLALRPCFNEFQFTFVGNGALFDQTVESLRDFPNVTLEKTFLNQREIKKYHSQNGVFLSPTRMDSQGVSRDEAMASGLVPITTDVAAVPEFVDSNCGFLLPEENALAIADALEFLHDNPEKFLNYSINAARRVARQSTLNKIINQELELIL